MPESLFWCFLVNFAKFIRTPSFQNSTGRLLLIIAVSIVTKAVLANETINYVTKTKAYVLIWSRKCKLLKRAVQVKEQVSEAVVRRVEIRCSLKFVNSTGKHLCWSLSFFNKAAGLKTCNSVKRRLQHRGFPVKFAKSPRTHFLPKSSSGCF